jgi:rhodanese-related sulfurtransferase
MKSIKIFSFLLVLLLSSTVVYGSCGSCGPADACPDGSCAVEEKDHDHDSKEETKHEHKKEVSECSSCESHSAKEKVVEKKVVEEKPATINTLGLKTLIDTGAASILLDARSGKYDDGKRIPGAKSLNADSKPDEVFKVLPDKDALIITYCSNLKCPASHKLYTHLKTLGYKNLIEYPEGIKGWIDAGYTVTNSK